MTPAQKNMVIYTKSNHTVLSTPGCVIMSGVGPPVGIVGRREKGEGKHLYTNDRKKSQDAKQTKKLSLLIHGYQFSLLWF